MARPELGQFGKLEPEDFERHPVWIGRHTADYGRPWCESTDEETFRPWTPHWIYDSFFVILEIAAEVEKPGIAGVSFCPVLDHRTGAELTDPVQLLISTTFRCAEVTPLPSVTCRPDHAEVMAIRKRWPSKPQTDGERATKPSWWTDKMEPDLPRIAAIPYCGRLNYHLPTSEAIIPNSVDDAPDILQSAEWIGSGALAFRLTFACKKFVALIRERTCKGLVPSEVSQPGFSETRELNS
jgi:hypothetical protein